MMTRRYTSLYITKGITYYLDRIDKFIHLDFGPDSNRKLALRLKHVTKSLTSARVCLACWPIDLKDDSIGSLSQAAMHVVAPAFRYVSRATAFLFSPSAVN
jgi:hypothetical protein